MPKDQSIDDQLRKALETCGKSRYAIAKESGVGYATLSRYLNGERDIYLATAAILCRYLGLRLTSGRQRK